MSDRGPKVGDVTGAAVTPDRRAKAASVAVAPGAMVPAGGSQWCAGSNGGTPAGGVVAVLD
jgi:hypothetical protein